MPTIKTERLTKRYKNFYAIKDVSLQVTKGDIYGLIGLNGSGKTTAINMLLGITKPTSGSCYLNGRKVAPTDNDLWKHVGYVVDRPRSYPELTVEENLALFQRLYRLPKESNRIAAVIEKLHLSAYINVKAKDLSFGNTQRLGIAKALLHSPDILILDEPMNGLDPAGIVSLRNLLLQLAAEGTTIFISSHLLSEVAKIATKVGILHEGKLVQEIDTKQLPTLLHRRLIISTRHNEKAIAKLREKYTFATEHDNDLIVMREEKAFQRPEEVSRFLVACGFPPTTLYVEEENLEAYFLRVIHERRG